MVILWRKCKGSVLILALWINIYMSTHMFTYLTIKIDKYFEDLERDRKCRSYSISYGIGTSLEKKIARKIVWIVWWRFSVLQEFRKEEDLGRIGLGRAPLSQSVVTSSVVWIRGENMVCSAKEGWQARHESLEQGLVRERSPWGSYVQEGCVWHEVESNKRRTSQVVHWLRFCLPVQGHDSICGLGRSYMPDGK